MGWLGQNGVCFQTWNECPLWLMDELTRFWRSLRCHAATLVSVKPTQIKPADSWFWLVEVTVTWNLVRLYVKIALRDFCSMWHKFTFGLEGKLVTFWRSAVTVSFPIMKPHSEGWPNQSCRHSGLAKLWPLLHLISSVTQNLLQDIESLSVTLPQKPTQLFFLTHHFTFSVHFNNVVWNNIDISSVICNSIDVELTLLIFGVYLASFCHPLTFPLCWNIHLLCPKWVSVFLCSRECIPVVNPGWFFENCIYDMCQFNNQQHVLCDHLQTYTAACRSAGVEQWRSPDFCRKSSAFQSDIHSLSCREFIILSLFLVEGQDILFVGSFL